MLLHRLRIGLRTPAAEESSRINLQPVGLPIRRPLIHIVSHVLALLLRSVRVVVRRKPPDLSRGMQRNKRVPQVVGGLGEHVGEGAVGLEVLDICVHRQAG